MSYGSSSTNSLRSPVAPGDSAGYDRYIDQQVAKTGSQLKLVDICSSLMALGAGVLSFLLIVTVVDHWIFSLGPAGRWTALTLLAGGAGWYLARVLLPVLLGRVNPLFAARTIEHSDPSLKNSLINFLLFRSDRAGVRAGVYQALEQRAAADLSHVPVDTAVDHSRLIRIGYLLAAVLAACAAYTILAPKSPFQSMARILAPWAEIERPSRVRIEDLQPGNVELFQGEWITVSADCYDLRPDEPVTVGYTTLDEQLGQQSAVMQPGAANLRYECRLPPDDEGFQRDVMYWIQAGDARTAAYRVRVVPAPVILVESIEYEYPAYTKLPKRVVERQGDVKAVEGTRVTIRARTNQPILAAVLEFDPPPPEAQAPAAAESSFRGPLATSAHRIEMEFREQEAWCSFVCEMDEQRQEPKYRTYQLRFSTPGGHRNPQPVLHRIEVLRDLPPEIEILTPTQDRVEVPEDGWQKLEIRAVDPDFGLTAIRLEAVAGGRQLLKRDLLQDPAGRSGQELASFDFAPRAYGMQAGTEAKCWAVAEDSRTSPQTGSPEPNVVKSRELTLVVTRAAAPTPADQPPDEPQEPGGKPAAGQPPENAGDQPPPGGQPPQGAQNPQDSQPPSASPGDSETGQGQQDQGSSAKQPSGGGEGSSGSGQQGSGDASQSSQAGGAGSNADSAASESGQDSSPSSGNMPGEGNSDSASGTEGSQTDDGSASGQPGSGGTQGGAGGTQGGESGGSAGGQADPGQSGEPLHDGEAFEKTMQYMQQAAQDQGQGQEGSSSGGADAQTGGQGSPKPADAPGQDASQQGTSSGSGKPSKSAPGGQPQPAAGAGQSSNQDEPQAPKPDDSPAGAGDQQDAGAKPSPGQKPADQGMSSGQSQPGDSGSQSPQQEPTPQQGGSPQQGQSKSGQQKQPGQSDGGQSGSGQPNKSQGGSGGGQNPQGTNRKQPSSGGGEPNPSQEPQASNLSKKASGSQSDAGGNQSGGGEQGGGQGGQQPGNDKPGGTSPGDQGAGAAQESGQGDPAQRPGTSQESQQRTGESGYDPGAGTKTQPSAEGTAGAGSQDQSGQGGPSPSAPQSPTAGSPADRGQGLPQGGGLPSNAELQGGDMSGEVPDGEQPNLEYARKATDMVLEYLKDQESNPDEDLLKKLGWTPEDLQEFARRWTELKRAASEDPRAKQQLDDALRSLGLRPAARDPRRSDVKQDTRRTERNLGDRSQPPSAYSELFDAYRKGTGRVGER